MPPAPLGRITRGTTGLNRLRRSDRFIARHPAFLSHSAPLVVDLGYGARGDTAIELASRLLPHNPNARFLGLEIDPERVSRAKEQLAKIDQKLPLNFARGGFEIPTPDAAPATIIRAMNVLRQYDEPEAYQAWETMAKRIEPGGFILEGTSNENGRVASWVEIDHSAQARSLTFSLHLDTLADPAIVAERLPKVLIHHNVSPEPIHQLIQDLKKNWEYQAALATFSARQRWISSIRALKESGWQVLGNQKQWRLGEVSINWEQLKNS